MDDLQESIRWMQVAAATDAVKSEGMDDAHEHMI